MSEPRRWDTFEGWRELYRRHAKDLRAATRRLAAAEQAHRRGDHLDWEQAKHDQEKASMWMDIYAHRIARYLLRNPGRVR